MKSMRRNRGGASDGAAEAAAPVAAAAAMPADASAAAAVVKGPSLQQQVTKPDPSDGSNKATLDGPGIPPADLDAAYRRLALGIAPLFAAVVAVNNIDHNNIGYASISLIPILKLSPAAYGLGSSLFYATYILGLIPAALLVPHIGARRMLTVMLFCWGVVATCMSLVHNAGSLYALRLMLGLCQSGSMPAMWCHITDNFPRTRLPKMFAYLYFGVALSGLLGGPLAAGLLALDGVGGLHGYQWLFILEGIPAVILAVLVFFLLPDSPSNVRGLTPEQLAGLKADLNAETLDAEVRRGTPAWRLMLAVVKTRFFPILVLIHILAGLVTSIFAYWSPLIIQSLLSGTTLTPEAAKGASAKRSLPAVGLSTVLYAAGAAGCLIASASAQRRKELFLHAGLPLLTAGILTTCFPVLTAAHPAAGFVALVLTFTLALSSNPTISSVIALINKGPQQVVALPLFDAFVMIGALVGAPVAGLVIQKSKKGFTYVTIVMGALIMFAACLILLLGVWVAHSPIAERLHLKQRRRFKVVDHPAGVASPVEVCVDGASAKEPPAK